MVFLVDRGGGVRMGWDFPLVFVSVLGMDADLFD